MNELTELLECSDDPAARRVARQTVDGVTDVILHPVDWTKKVLAARAAEKAAEEVKLKAAEEAEWARSGAPLSKKADALLTILKWGVILGPITYLVATFAPLIRGTGAALSGAGTALKGAGEAAREGAASVKTIREKYRRNPGPLIPFGFLPAGEFRNRFLALKTMKLWAMMGEVRFRGTPDEIIWLAWIEAIAFVETSPMTASYRTLLSNEAKLTGHVNRLMMDATYAERNSQPDRARKLRIKATALSAIFQYLSNVNAPKPEMPEMGERP